MSVFEQNPIITRAEELTIFNDLVSNKIQSLEQFETLMQEWYSYCNFIETTNTKPENYLSLMEFYELSA